MMAVEGQVIAQKYRLERHLGSGGFASVWAARIIALDRPVALKILSDNLACNKETVNRFIREAKLSARAIHPTIVQVEDIGTTEQGIPFLVMELLEGRPLSDVLWERGALSLKESASILHLLLQGLSAAHSLGIIHRDVKPGNIFLVDASSPQERVKILDLGLAKDLDASEALTRSGMVMGTPDYLAPELLALNQKHAWSPASDIFALGVVSYRMLSGHRPLDGLVAPDPSPMGFIKRAAFYAKHTSSPRWAPELPRHVPADLADVVYCALSVDRERRFKDASSMLSAFEQARAPLGLSLDDELHETGERHLAPDDRLDGETLPMHAWNSSDQGAQVAHSSEASLEDQPTIVDHQPPHTYDDGQRLSEPPYPSAVGPDDVGLSSSSLGTHPPRRLSLVFAFVLVTIVFALSAIVLLLWAIASS